MKLRAVTVNRRKRHLELITVGRRTLPFPFARMDPAPDAAGAVHVDHALEYNSDPNYLHERILHKSTIETLSRITHSAHRFELDGRSMRERRAYLNADR